MPVAWRFEERLESAASLHRSWPSVADQPERRAVAVCRVTDTAIVLGSTQAETVVDRARVDAAGVSIVRRSSGGGAVFVAPGDPVWVDVWIPADDPLWLPQVDRAFDWLGQAWVAALAGVGVTGLRAHAEGFVACTRWSSVVCFGGVGVGEVITEDGRKVVGLAQRRTRRGAWFHGACILWWEPGRLVELLAFDDEERGQAVRGLGAAVVGVADLAGELGLAVPDAEAITSSFIDTLP